MPIYKIKDWDKIFENHESRKLKNLTWVPVPNKWDGLGFVRLKKHKRFAEILGGWLLLLQIASKSNPRGSLCRENLPLSPEDMGDVTGVPESVFILTLGVLANPEHGINWIIADGDIQNEAKTGESPDMSGKSPGTPPPNGTEGKGKNGTEGKVVIPPTFEEFKKYCQEDLKKYDLDTENIYKSYEVNNWIDSQGNKIKNWKMKLRQVWCKKNKTNYSNPNTSGLAIGQKYHEEEPLVWNK